MCQSSEPPSSLSMFSKLKKGFTISQGLGSSARNLLAGKMTTTDLDRAASSEDLVTPTASPGARRSGARMSLSRKRSIEALSNWKDITQTIARQHYAPVLQLLVRDLLVAGLAGSVWSFAARF